jgi:hypothetical protein
MSKRMKWLAKGGPWVPRRLEMLQSPAYRSLNRIDLLVLARLEIEHMLKRGKANGELICTYLDFEAYGIRQSSVNAGLRRLAQAGFLERTERGWRSAGADKRPAKYRLTYLPTLKGDSVVDPTDEWRHFKPKPKPTRAKPTPPPNPAQTAPRAPAPPWTAWPADVLNFPSTGDADINIPLTGTAGPKKWN